MPIRCGPTGELSGAMFDQPPKVIDLYGSNNVEAGQRVAGDCEVPDAQVDLDARGMIRPGGFLDGLAILTAEDATQFDEIGFAVGEHHLYASL
jgi:hypothetical protein